MAVPADVDPELVRTFRAYQRAGSYKGAAADLDLSVPQVKRRLRALYAQVGANSGVQAALLLREMAS